MSALPFDSYVICTSPRSGSTLLCELLKGTGIAGRPDSHFHTPSFDRWLEVYGLTDRQFASHAAALDAVFAAAIAKGTGETGIFGLRLQRGSFSFFQEQLAVLHPGHTRDVARIEAAFGRTRFIHLRRHDKLDQAVSLSIAEQSGLWHRAADGSEYERTAPPQAPKYDRDDIARHMEDLAGMDADWEAWFERENVMPLRLSYDDLAAAPRETLGRVLEALGLDPSGASDSEVPMAKLADATSRAWKDAFLQETTE